MPTPGSFSCKMQVWAALALAAMAVPGAARAERRPLDISGFVGLRTFAADSQLGAENPNNVKVINSMIFGARLHYVLAPRFLVEGELPLLISKTTEAAADLHVLFIHPRAQLTFDPMPEQAWQPLASAGLGVASSDFVAERELVPQGYLDVGVRLPRSLKWNARLDLRWILGPARDDGVAHEFEVLLSFYRPEPADRGSLESVLRDSDSDGLMDDEDQCPEQPEDMDDYEDADGCPDPDNDGDGVLDIEDECPLQPETRNDYRDDDGCGDEVPERMKGFTGRIEGITFELDSATLRPSSYPVLDRAVEVLDEFGDLRVTIVGHTDNIGTDEYNLDLSQRRAETVRDYLIERGVAAERLTAEGKGKTQPIDDNDTEEGRANNRRVEFLVN